MLVQRPTSSPESISPLRQLSFGRSAHVPSYGKRLARCSHRQSFVFQYCNSSPLAKIPAKPTLDLSSGTKRALVRISDRCWGCKSSIKVASESPEWGTAGRRHTVEPTSQSHRGKTALSERIWTGECYDLINLKTTVLNHVNL